MRRTGLWASSCLFVGTALSACSSEPAPSNPAAGGTSATAGGGSGGGSAGFSGGAGGSAAGTGGLAGAGGGAAQPSPRVDTLINDAWKFNRGDVAGAEQAAFDDSAWATQNLPHTWNAMDGQDGPSTPYYRGIGWYRRHLTPPAELTGKKLYLQFDGSNIITDVWVNGTAVGSHSGGYATFRFDVSSLLTVGADNVIAVKVNNEAGVDTSHVLIPGSLTVNIPPLSGDFTMFGGLYRNVHLLATDPLAINVMNYGSPGVFIKQTNVSSASADLAVTVELTNANAEQKTADVTASIVDVTGAVVQTLSGSQAVAAGATTPVVLTGTMASPHLWNGLADPYLYTVRVEVKEGTRLSDSLTQPLGLRSFALDPNTGFSLNGTYLDLHGVNKHQDAKDKGWAIAEADTEADFDVIEEIGATMVRLAHYQHAQHTYDVADRRGYVIWAETPVVNKINNTPEFAANAEQQLIELIRQNYNHPSIIFWSTGNEVLLRTGPDPDPLMAYLAEVTAYEDPTRLSAYAANGSNENSPVNWHTTANGFNEYQGWYYGKVADFATWADTTHASHPSHCVGVTEYGAGGSIDQHTANPAAADVGGDHTGAAHTEEYQAYYHEGYWTAMKDRPFLWGKLVWNGFDFASDGRTEGGSFGLNDKGLVTFDRQTKKDAFYWYKANWSSQPFVHITSRRFATLPSASTTIKVYSNLGSVELKLNQASLGAKTSTNRIFTWTSVAWAAGDNVVEASGTSGATVVSDQVTWQN